MQRSVNPRCSWAVAWFATQKHAAVQRSVPTHMQRATQRAQHEMVPDSEACKKKACKKKRANKSVTGQCKVRAENNFTGHGAPRTGGAIFGAKEQQQGWRLPATAADGAVQRGASLAGRWSTTEETPPLNTCSGNSEASIWEIAKHPSSRWRTRETLVILNA